MYNTSQDPALTAYERPNKSQSKRDAQALLSVARDLAELREEQWSTLSLPVPVLDALSDLLDMPQYGARKRQFKLIAKLLRDVDVSLALQLIAQLQQKGNEVNAAFHLLERWRDRLLSGDMEVLTDFITQYPEVDVQRLRQLVKNARFEKAQAKPPKSSRLLFQLIKPLLEES